MAHRGSLISRERVRLALTDEETDRVPIATVYAGINPPAYRELEACLTRERGLTVRGYLDPLIDVVQVEPGYIGPALAPGEDMWGVRRAVVSYGDGAYDEITHYPLALAGNPADLEAHRWPSAVWFDYDMLPQANCRGPGGWRTAYHGSQRQHFRERLVHARVRAHVHGLGAQPRPSPRH